MWSHYSTERGFMIEFDYDSLKLNTLKKFNSHLLKSEIFPIQYVNEVEKINLMDEKFKSNRIPVLYAHSIKREDWKYENEWRLMTVVNENYGVPCSIMEPIDDIKGSLERKIFYPKAAIKSITLGKHFFNGSNIKELIGTNGTDYIMKKDLDILNHLYHCYNDKLFLSGEYEKGSIFKRFSQKIRLYKDSRNHFGIHIPD